MTGAPSEPNHSFEEYSLSDSFEDYGEIKDIEANGIIDKAVKKLKCMVNATSTVLKDTEFGKPWEELVRDLENFVDRIRACKEKPTDSAEAM